MMAQQQTLKGDRCDEVGSSGGTTRLADIYTVNSIRQIIDLARVQCNIPGVCFIPVVNSSSGNPATFLQNQFTLIRKDTGERVLARQEFRYCRTLKLPEKAGIITMRKWMKDFAESRRDVESLCPYLLPHVQESTVPIGVTGCCYMFVWHCPRERRHH